jgi:ADP-ribose pyrophosphatase YjhB (NUDIX family)
VSEAVPYRHPRGRAVAPEQGLIPPERYGEITTTTPIVCVDMLLHNDAGEQLLVWRADRSSREGWALLGGNLWLDESIDVAAHRHLADSVGPGARVEEVDWARPDLVVEHSREPEPTQPWDPQKHSVGLTYRGLIAGELDGGSGAEALALRFFAVTALPAAEEFVFNHGATVARLLSDAS